MRPSPAPALTECLSRGLWGAPPLGGVCLFNVKERDGLLPRDSVRFRAIGAAGWGAVRAA